MELRAGKRRHLTYYPRVRDQRTGAEVGRVADLNDHGLLLVGGQGLTVGATHALELLPPEFCGPELQPIAVEVEVRWAHPDVNPALQSTGCRFVGAVDKAAVWLWIAEMGFDD